MPAIAVALVFSVVAAPQSAFAQTSTSSASSTTSVPDVPFYSQFADISSPKWQKVGCGIADLAMIIDFYKPGAVTVNQLLAQGIAAGAYDPKAGWIYAGLIGLSDHYGLTGQYVDLTAQSESAALARIETYLQAGPIIQSVHYKFDPKSTIPHLVVIDAIQNGVVYYNDPAANAGTKEVSLSNYVSGWKKKVIVIRPAHSAPNLAVD